MVLSRNQAVGVPEQAESVAERTLRIERERAVIEMAEADIDAGLGIDGDELEQWLDHLERNENIPLPALGVAARSVR